MNMLKSCTVAVGLLLISACQAPPAQNVDQEVNAADNSVEVLQSETEDQTDNLNELAGELNSKGAKVGGAKGKALEKEAALDQAMARAIQNDAAAKTELIEDKAQNDVNAANAPH